MSLFNLRYLCLILLGFLIGKSCTQLVFGLAVAAALCSIAYFAYKQSKNLPIGNLYNETFQLVVIIALVVMSVTYYITTGQTVVQDLAHSIGGIFSRYILR